MFLCFFAPQGLKGMAAAVQRIKFGGSRPFAAQITPPNLMCCHPGVLFHVLCSEFILYWTGLTGFTGYFFGLPVANFGKIFPRP
jgi:hypothetical protein